MVASASETPGSVGNIKALREIKKAEEEVREQRAEAEEKASEILQDARTKARKLIQERKEAAQAEAEGILEQAEAEAEAKAEELLEQAEAEAAELRKVPDERLDEAADKVLDRFRSTVGGA